MSIPVLRIFVSSPGDVRAEREITRAMIDRLGLLLHGRLRLEYCFWEDGLMLTTNGDFQSQIPNPAGFDLLIGILGARLGSPLHPGLHRRADGSPYSSGTEYEFECAINAHEQTGRPELLVYRASTLPKVDLDAEDYEERPAQWRALKAFCARWFIDQGASVRAYNSYANLDAFERKLESDLKTFTGRRLAGPLLPNSRRREPFPGSPYRGLKVFDMEHHALFFGRTRERGEVLDLLRERAEEGCPFVLIFGASGSGKSSLLRAGVMSLLARNVVEGVGVWRWTVWQPSDAPPGGDLIDGLAHALLGEKALPELAADGTHATTLAALLRQDPARASGLVQGALSQAAAAAKRERGQTGQPAARLAVGLDQLEEAFTVERFSPACREEFFRAVGSLARSGLVWVTATLRSDFYGCCEEHPELVDLARDKGQYRLLAPCAADLKRMILLPAEAAGIAFEDRPDKGPLEDRLLAEARAELGALPLLEFALDELYRAGAASGLLTHEDYERLARSEGVSSGAATPGLAGALAGRAEKTFAALPSRAQGSLDGVLRQLARLGEGEDEVPARRTAPHAAATRAVGASELVDAFLAARLLVGDQDAAGERTVTVAHEALLRSWPRAAEWARANRDFLRLRARLGQSISRWKEGGERREDFLAGRHLADGEHLLFNHHADLESAERVFIRASLAKRDAARRRILWLSGAAAAVALLLSSAAYWKFAEARQSNDKAKRYLEYAAKTLREAARNDVQEARVYFQGGSEAQAFAQLARAHQYEVTPTAAAVAVSWLHASSLRPPRVVLAGHAGVIWSAQFSPDGTRVITASEDGTARLWDAWTGEVVGEAMKTAEDLHGLKLWNSVTTAAFSSDGKRILTGDWLGNAVIWNGESGRRLVMLGERTKGINHVVFSPDGRLALTASSDGSARLWNAFTGAEVGEGMMHEDRVNHAAFSPDGRLVLTASDDGTARLWDVHTGQPTGNWMSHENGVWLAVFSPDGRTIATASLDGAARVWDAATGEAVGEPIQHEAAIWSVAFSPDSGCVLTGSRDHTARRWDAASGRPIGEVLSHEDDVIEAKFSPDGRWWLTASADGSVRLWDAKTGQPNGKPFTFYGQIESAEFSPDSRRVLAAGSGGTVRIWEIESALGLGRLMRHENDLRAAMLSPDGSRVLTLDAEGAARLWKAETGELLAEALDHPNISSAVFSRDSHLLLTAGADDFVKLWSAGNGKPSGEPILQKGARSATFSPDARRILIESSSEKDSWQLWDVDSRRFIVALPAKSRGYDAKWIHHTDRRRRPVEMEAEGNEAFVDAFTNQPLNVRVSEKLSGRPVFSSDGRRLVLVLEDHSAALLVDAQSGQPVGEPLRHEGGVNNAIFSPDGQQVLTTGRYGARFWHSSTGRVNGESLRADAVVTDAIFSADSRLLLLKMKDQMVELWSVESRRKLGETLHHDGSIRRMALAFHGGRILTADHRQACLWDPFAGRRIATLPVHELDREVILSPDSDLLLTGNADGTVRLSEAINGNAVGQSLHHEKGVRSAVFSPDGRSVLTHGADGSVRRWNATTGDLLGEPLIAGGRFVCAVFSADSQSILTAGSDRTARIWELPPGDAGMAPAWFSSFLRWRAQARLDDNGVFRYETGEEQLATRKELFDALAAYPANEKSFYVRFARRFVPEGSLARGR